MTSWYPVWELAKRTVRECSDDDCAHMAAGIAYYALFSIFPLLLSLIAIFAAIRRAVNRAWDVTRERLFIRQKLVELGMVAGVGAIFLVSMPTTAFLRLAWQFLPPQLRQLDGSGPWSVGLSALPIAFSFCMFALIYRFVPSEEVAWRDVWPGAFLAAVLYELAKNAFAWYLANFARYSLVYGSLGAVIVFLFWAYISAFILLLGAEFASEYLRMFGSQKRRLAEPPVEV